MLRSSATCAGRVDQRGPAVVVERLHRPPEDEQIRLGRRPEGREQVVEVQGRAGGNCSGASAIRNGGAFLMNSFSAMRYIHRDTRFAESLSRVWSGSGRRSPLRCRPAGAPWDQRRTSSTGSVGYRCLRRRAPGDCSCSEDHDDASPVRYVTVARRICLSPGPAMRSSSGRSLKGRREVPAELGQRQSQARSRASGAAGGALIPIRLDPATYAQRPRDLGRILKVTACLRWLPGWLPRRAHRQRQGLGLGDPGRPERRVRHYRLRGGSAARGGGPRAETDDTARRGAVLPGDRALLPGLLLRRDRLLGPGAHDWFPRFQLR